MSCEPEKSEAGRLERARAVGDLLTRPVILLADLLGWPFRLTRLRRWLYNRLRWLTSLPGRIQARKGSVKAHRTVFAACIFCAFLFTHLNITRARLAPGARLEPPWRGQECGFMRAVCSIAACQIRFLNLRRFSRPSP